MPERCLKAQKLVHSHTDNHVFIAKKTRPHQLSLSHNKSCRQITDPKVTGRRKLSILTPFCHLSDNSSFVKNNIKKLAWCLLLLTN